MYYAPVDDGYDKDDTLMQSPERLSDRGVHFRTEKSEDEELEDARLDLKRRPTSFNELLFH